MNGRDFAVSPDSGLLALSLKANSDAPNKQWIVAMDKLTSETEGILRVGGQELKMSPLELGVGYIFCHAA